MSKRFGPHDDLTRPASDPRRGPADRRRHRQAARDYCASA